MGEWFWNTENQVRNKQGCFRRGSGCIDEESFLLKIIAEKYREIDNFTLHL